MKDLKVEFTNYKTYDMRCSPTSKLRIGSNLLEPQDKSYYNLKVAQAYTYVYARGKYVYIGAH